MSVGERRDTGDVLLADLLEENCDELVKAIMPDLDAIRVSDGFDTHLLVGFLGGDFQRGLGFFDERLDGFAGVNRHF